MLLNCVGQHERQTECTACEYEGHIIWFKQVTADKTHFTSLSCANVFVELEPGF